MPWSEYFEKFLNHDRLATGRLINLLESGEDREEIQALMRACLEQNKEAYVVGITGVPGAGKSTLIDQLAGWLLDQGHTVGIICVDPSSPFRGGAILGDRVRFKNLSRREGCFVRSMATRGHLGGLGVATHDVVQLLEAGGYDVIIVETVGTGQSEVEIVQTADTVVLVTVPGLGDQMQVVKSGIMEVGDIFVVNQSDRPGADDTLRRLRTDIAMYSNRDWRPTVVSTVATQNKGIADLGEAIIQRRDFLVEKGEKEHLRKRRDLEAWNKLLVERFSDALHDFMAQDELGETVKKKLESGEINIYEASCEVWDGLMKSCATRS